MSGVTLRPEVPVCVGAPRDVRPVMLLTFNVPFDERAVAFAVDSAVEAGAELYICDAIPLAVGNPAACGSRSFADVDNRRDFDAVGALARSCGVRVTQVAFHNPKPVNATLDVLRDLDIGLLVFGPSRKRVSRWTFRRAARRLRTEATCLVWTNEG